MKSLLLAASISARRSALSALGMGAAAVAVLALAAAPAAAADAITIPVKESQVPTTASGFGEHENCDEITARPGMDAWHFVLPGNNYDFVTVVGEFAETEDAEVADFTATAPGPYGEFPQNGNSAGKHVYLFAPAGMWLIGATATISGTGTQPEEFVLSHTCPGTTTSPSPSESPSESPSPSISPSESLSPTISPSESLSPSESVSPSASVSDSTVVDGATPSSVVGGSAGGDDLPVTGTALTGVIGAGVLMLAGGVALTVFARRRRAQD